MNFKYSKKLSVHMVRRSILIILLLAILCAFLICLYYLVQPQAYRATLTFSLSDSVGKPLPVDRQNSAIALLFLQPTVFNSSNSNRFFFDGSHKKNFHENIYLFRNGDLFNLVFETETISAAKHGLENLFSIFSETIIKQDEKLLLKQQQVNRQYDSATVLNIMQEFRSSVDSFMHKDVKQNELNDLYVQLSEATLKRIHLTSLSSVIKMMRESGQSLLSLSFISNNSAVAALESKRNLLESQKAHMAAQLGWDHPQIKAMSAESEAISHQLENKVLQIVNQIHADKIIAEDFELQLRKRISLFVKDQSESLNQMLNELENKIRGVIDEKNKVINKPFSLQNIKVHVVVPTTLVPISFMTLYKKNIIVSAFISLLILGGGLLLWQQCFRIRKKQLEKNDKGILVSKKIKNLEVFITIEELSNFFKWRDSAVISVMGPEAARTAAKLSLHLTKDHKTILLVDVSGQQIEKAIGPHRGLSDILGGHAQLQDVIYRDYDTGIDILPQGLTPITCAQDFPNCIFGVLQEFKSNYDFIIFEIANEPQYGFEQFVELSDYYICNADLNEQSWMIKMIHKFPKTVYRVIGS
ncbi:hypothetical protein [Bartonella sp. B30(2025)]